jgi:hypothetical protein
VLVDTPQLLAIARCVNPSSYFSLRISSIFLMDKLACGIATSSFSFSKRIIDFLEFIQPASPFFQHFLIDIAGIRDRHRRNH